MQDSHSSSTKSTRQRPSTDDPHLWIAYWRALGQPWRIEPEIGVERQKYLTTLLAKNRAIQDSVGPFHSVRINRSDIEWLLSQETSIRDIDGQPQIDLRGAKLSRVNIAGLDLSRIILDNQSPNLNRPLPNMNRPLQQSPVMKSTRTRARTAAELLSAYSNGIRDFQGSSLDGVNLTGADLRGIDLSEASLKGARLRNATLMSAKLCKCDLDKADLSDADLREALVTNANLNGADLSKAILWRANLSGTSARGAILREANLSHAQLQDTDFDSADLTRAYLKDALMAGTKLHNANLQDVGIPRRERGESLHVYHDGRYSSIYDKYPT